MSSKAEPSAVQARTSNVSRVYAYLTGAGSILDVSGKTRWFEEISPGCRRHSLDGVWTGPNDYAAVGADLTRALVLWVSEASTAERKELFKRLSEVLNKAENPSAAWVYPSPDAVPRTVLRKVIRRNYASRPTSLGQNGDTGSVGEFERTGEH